MSFQLATAASGNPFNFVNELNVHERVSRVRNVHWQTTGPKLLILVASFSGEVTLYTDISYCIYISWEVSHSVFFWATLYNGGQGRAAKKRRRKGHHTYELHKLHRQQDPPPRGQIHHYLPCYNIQLTNWILWNGHFYHIEVIDLPFHTIPFVSWFISLIDNTKMNFYWKFTSKFGIIFVLQSLLGSLFLALRTTLALMRSCVRSQELCARTMTMKDAYQVKITLQSRAPNVDSNSLT